MRILVLNPFGTDKYDPLMKKILEPVKLMETELVVDHLANGPDYIDFWYYRQMVQMDVVERILKAEKEGYDGVFVACGYEPGVRAAREVVDIPVVGALIPTVLIALQMGRKYSVFYPTKYPANNAWDILKVYDLDKSCASMKSVDLWLREIVENPQKNEERVISLAREAKDEGADVIVMACTIVAAYFSGKLPDDLAGMTFLNCNVCGLKYLEMLVDLQKKAGVKVSRIAYYAKPQEINQKDFQKFREMYDLHV